MAQIPGTPKMESRICPGGTPRTLNRHNSRLQSWIATRSKPKLQPLSRSFQRHVAHSNRMSRRHRFPTFSGWESNCQFDSRSFFCDTLATTKHASGKNVVKQLGLDRRSIYRSLQRCLLIDDDTLDFWSRIRSQQQSNAISTKTKTLVLD